MNVAFFFLSHPEVIRAAIVIQRHKDVSYEIELIKDVWDV